MGTSRKLIWVTNTLRADDPFIDSEERAHGGSGRYWEWRSQFVEGEPQKNADKSREVGLYRWEVAPLPSSGLITPSISSGRDGGQRN